MFQNQSEATRQKVEAHHTRSESGSKKLKPIKNIRPSNDLSKRKHVSKKQVLIDDGTWHVDEEVFSPTTAQDSTNRNTITTTKFFDDDD